MSYNKMIPTNNLEDQVEYFKLSFANNKKLYIGFVLMCSTLFILLLILRLPLVEMIVLGSIDLIIIVVSITKYFSYLNKKIHIGIIDVENNYQKTKVFISKYKEDTVEFHYLLTSERLKKVLKSLDIIYIMNDTKIATELKSTLQYIQTRHPKPILWNQVPENFKYNKVKVKYVKLLLKRIDFGLSILLFITAIIFVLQNFIPSLDYEISYNNATPALILISSFFSFLIAGGLSRETILKQAMNKFTYDNFKRLNQAPIYGVV